jgi:hypothetical protein
MVSGFISDFIFSFDPPPPILVRLPAKPPDLLCPRIKCLLLFLAERHLFAVLLAVFIFAFTLFPKQLHAKTSSKNKKAHSLARAVIGGNQRGRAKKVGRIVPGARKQPGDIESY